MERSGEDGCLSPCAVDVESDLAAAVGEAGCCVQQLVAPSEVLAGTAPTSDQQDAT